MWLRPRSLAAPLALLALLAAGCAGLVERGEHPLAFLSREPALLSQAPIFSADDPPLVPGGPATVHSVTISRRAGSDGWARLHVSHFVARSPQSASTCSAPDPADRIQLRVSVDGRVLFDGSLSGFASEHPSKLTALPLAPLGSRVADSLRVTLEARLDQSASNAYMGCLTSADLSWEADSSAGS